MLEHSSRKVAMGSSIPSSPRSDVLAWCQAHVDVFTTNAAAIGITPAQATAFKTLVNTFAAKEAAKEAARIAAETATQASNDAYTPMRRQMTQIVAAVRAFAIDTNNPRVLELAQVPPRAEPSSIGPPGKPTNMTVELVPGTGAVQIRWRSVNPQGASGTSYIVRRKLPTEQAFSFLGVTGERRFVDNSFVAGPDTVQYTVQGQRADSAGAESDIFVVRFGREGPRIVSIMDVTVGHDSLNATSGGRKAA
jgi:hypothetical protein